MGEEKSGWLGPRTGLRMVGRALRSRVLWLGLLLGAAATVGVLRVVRPMYRSEVVLFYRPSPGASFVAQTEGDPTGQLAARLKEMLFTRERLAGLIKEFHLYPDEVMSTGLLDAAETMRKQHLKFQSSGGETFRISFEEEDPRLAQAVAARAAEMLLEVHRTWRTQDVVKTQQFFDAQKRVAEEVLRAREMEFTQFLSRHPEMALAMGTGPVALGASLRAASSESKLNSQDGLVSKLEARAARLRDRGSEPAKPDKRGEPAVPAVAVDPALLAEREAALADFVAARRDLAQKQKQFTSEYPDVRQANEAASAARERLRKVEDAIAAAKKAAAPPLSAPEPQTELGSLAPDPGTRQRLSAIEKQLVQARAKVLERDPKRLLEMSTQLAELDRRVSEARDRLALIQSKQFQASLEATLDLQDKTGELVVVDPAFLPARPERRSRLKTGAAGAASALALAFGLSLGLAFLSDRLRAGFDCARLSLPPLLAEVPRESRQERRRVRREVAAETKVIRRLL
jgi:hypothetical protein